jgi:hypothetical protein
LLADDDFAAFGDQVGHGGDCGVGSDGSDGPDRNHRSSGHGDAETEGL